MSDGIVETMNKNRDLYGFARLEATLQSCEAKDAKGILNSVFDSAFAFMGDMSPQDDMTLVVIKMRDR
jgi:serine phosphatase RsbU (regulator of sigma subunit)